MKGNVADYLGTAQYPWVIEATLNYSSNSHAHLILQTDANVVNGYAIFTTLGISEITDSFVISYKMKVPEGVNK